MEKRRLPKFESEAEEARWWYENREELGNDLAQAIREGRTGPGVMRRLEARRKAADTAQKKRLPVAS